MTSYITTDLDLIDAVSNADEDDLSVLADFITDNNNGRITLDTLFVGNWTHSSATAHFKKIPTSLSRKSRSSVVTPS